MAIVSKRKVVATGGGSRGRGDGGRGGKRIREVGGRRGRAVKAERGPLDSHRRVLHQRFCQVVVNAPSDVVVVATMCALTYLISTNRFANLGQDG